MMQRISIGDILKEIKSPSGEYKATIKKRPDGILEVNTYRWTHEVVPDYGEVCDPFWERMAGPSFVDAFETGMSVAAEQLRNCSGETDN